MRESKDIAKELNTSGSPMKPSYKKRNTVLETSLNQRRKSVMDLGMIQKRKSLFVSDIPQQNTVKKETSKAPNKFLTTETNRQNDVEKALNKLLRKYTYCEFFTGKFCCIKTRNNKYNEFVYEVHSVTSFGMLIRFLFGYYREEKQRKYRTDLLDEDDNILLEYQTITQEVKKNKDSYKMPYKKTNTNNNLEESKDSVKDIKDIILNKSDLPNNMNEISK